MLFKAIHGIAPINLSDRIVMNFDVNDYDTGESDMGWYPLHYVKRLIEIA